MDIQKLRGDLNRSVRTASHSKLTAEQHKRYTGFLWRWVAALGGHQLRHIGTGKALADSLSMFRYFDKTTTGKINTEVRSPPKEETTYVDIVIQNVPFAVASILNFFATQNFFIHTQYNFILFPEDKVHRQHNGLAFVVMRFELQALSAEEAAVCKEGIKNILTGIRISNRDWQPIKQKLSAAIAEYNAIVRPDSEQEKRRLDFLSWLAEDKCLFLGYGRADTEKASLTASLGPASSGGISPGPASLGLLRPQIRTPELLEAYARLPVREGIRFVKLPVRSLIHRPVYIEAITLGIRQEKDRITEHRFILLYAYDLYNYALENIPHLRETFNGLLKHFHLIRNSYRGRILRYSVASYPRNELLKIAGDDKLPNLVEPVMEAFSYSTLRCAHYYDNDKLFAQVLILMPRDDYDSGLRERFAELVQEIFDSDDCDFDILFSETQLVRIFFTLPLKVNPNIDAERLKNLQTELEAIGTGWNRKLRTAFIEKFGKHTGIKMFREHAGIFPEGYVSRQSVVGATSDILKVLSVGEGKELLEAEFDISGRKLRLFDRSDGPSLSQLVHILENLGTEPTASRPYLFEGAGKNSLKYSVRLTEFQLQYPPPKGDFLPPADELENLFAEHFTRIYKREAENDSFNRLTLKSGLSGDYVRLLRGLSAYLGQVQNHYDLAHVENAFCAHPEGLFLIKEMFVQKFDPRQKPKQKVYRALAGKFSDYADAIPSAEEDQIFRYLRELIGAIQRTNFYTRPPAANSVLSFKLSPRRLFYAEGWNPEREIFVYDIGFEGVHMRDGPLARGGIRWSDRRAGYRKEVLNLVAAQVLKNALIVPTGGKGGFYIKDPKLSPQDAYRKFIDALLQLTDNYAGGKVKRPAGMRIYDSEDTYLVVAPDKGTATFSDLANEVAVGHQYWLGDAFASGGSSGYNHKTMGITAEGAWVSVRRHFAELGRDLDKDRTDVVGIGDMSGDVFGNGMLLSKAICLIAAFNHRDIFIDPNPDPAVSYRERKRLFGLTASSWSDYNPKLMSAGGGVFARSAKSIRVSKEIAKRLNIRDKKIRPDMLIRHILLARADLLWFGGIGTYVKAASESNRDLGDKANAPMRVDGKDLRVRVIGEGANLGVTQAGRIEFAACGGRIATDAHDNSGGVHCSDKEVNIKILISQLKKMGASARIKLLQSMTEDVSQSVLAENYAQSLCLSLENYRAKEFFRVHQALMRRLGESLLPERDALTRPELSVLISKCKTYLRHHLAEQDTLKEPLLEKQLPLYYPQPLRKRMANRMHDIPFVKQVADVCIVNLLVDHLGLAPWADVDNEVLRQLPRFASHFLHLEHLFHFTRLGLELAAEARHYPKLLPSLIALRQTNARLIRFCMRHSPSYDAMRRNLPVLADVLAAKPDNSRSAPLPASMELEKEKRFEYMIAETAPELLFVSELSCKTGKKVRILWDLYQLLDEQLAIGSHIRSMEDMAVFRASDWERAVLRDLAEDFQEQAGRLMTAQLHASAGAASADAMFANWRERNPELLAQYQSAVAHHRHLSSADDKTLLMQYLTGLLKKMS